MKLANRRALFFVDRFHVQTDVSRISLMPLIKTIAITLKSRKWGDADRIVTFYTKERERFVQWQGGLVG